MIRLSEGENGERRDSLDEVLKSVFYGPVQGIEGVSHKSHSLFACGGWANNNRPVAGIIVILEGLAQVFVLPAVGDSKLEDASGSHTKSDALLPGCWSVKNCSYCGGDSHETARGSSVQHDKIYPG